MDYPGFIINLIQISYYTAKLGYISYSINFIVIDEAVNLTSEKHDPCAQTSHLHKRRQQEYLAEGTGVEPAKYPPKVKLEIFSQL